MKSYYDKRIVGCPGGEGGKFIPPSNFSGILMDDLSAIVVVIEYIEAHYRLVNYPI